MLHPIWVDGDAQLSHMTSVLQGDQLAIDTEFVRVNTFYPILALIQLSDGHQTFLIDPFCIKDWQPLVDLLLNPKVLKILHSAAEDMELLSVLTNQSPIKPIFDTQIAAAMSGMGISLGYANLVQQICGVSLPKDCTRSDWTMRPLTANQLVYAEQDVTYLHQLHTELSERLGEEKYHWVLSECAQRADQATHAVEYDLAWRKVRNAWRLQLQQLEALKQMCAWRESKARQIDSPKSWILNDQDLWVLAKNLPASFEQAAKIKHLNVIRLEPYWLEIELMLVAALATEDASCPKSLLGPLPIELSPLIKDLKRALKHLAEKKALASELLLTRHQIEGIARKASSQGNLVWPLAAQDWRTPILYEPIQEVIARHTMLQAKVVDGT